MRSAGQQTVCDGAPQVGAGGVAAAPCRYGAPESAHEPRTACGHPPEGHHRVIGDLLVLLTPLRQALNQLTPMDLA